MAVINFPDPAGQTPVNTFSPTSTPAASANGITYVYEGGVWKVNQSAGIDLSEYAKLVDPSQDITANKFIGSGAELTDVVNSLTAGPGLEVDVSTGDVTISQTYNPLEFGGTVDVTSDVIPAQVRTIEQLFVNTGSGNVSVAWAAVINNADTSTVANPGDFVIKDLGSAEADPWSLVSVGSPPSSDGTWVDDGAGSLYPVNLDNNVGIGTDTPNALLQLSAEEECQFQFDCPGDDSITRTGYMKWVLGGEDSGLLKVEKLAGETAAESSMVFRAGGSAPANNIMTLKGDTKFVGIGTSAPAGNLHISTSAGGRGIIFDQGDRAPDTFWTRLKASLPSGSPAYFQTDCYEFALRTEQADTAVLVSKEGNVGIGTTAPNTKLDVVANTGPNPQVEIKSGAADADGILGFPLAGNSKASIITNKYLTFHTGGTATSDANQRMVITGAGNVGIGTTSPNTKLHLKSNSALTASLKLENEGDGTAGQDSTQSLTAGLIGQHNVGFSIYDHKLSRATLYIDGTGNVGIGTTAPALTLHTQGSGILNQTEYNAADPTQAPIYFTNRQGGNWRTSSIVGSSSGKISFYTKGTGIGADATDLNFAAIIDDGGNVGIGTTTPSSLLHVQKAQAAAAAETIASFGTSSIADGFNVITTDGNLVWGLGTKNQRDLTLQTNQTDRVYIKGNTGNVGIGTSDPQRKLHVASAQFNVLRLDSTQSGSRVEFSDSGSSQYDTVSIGSEGNDFQINTNTSGSGVRRLTVKDNGRVGIGAGSADPVAQLEVKMPDSSTDPYFKGGGTRGLRIHDEQRASFDGDCTVFYKATGAGKFVFAGSNVDGVTAVGELEGGELFMINNLGAIQARAYRIDQLTELT